MTLEVGEEALRVERGRAARAGRGDRLAIDVILDVAGREDAGDVRLRRLSPGEQVAVLVVVERVEEEGSSWIVADRDEEPSVEYSNASPVSTLRGGRRSACPHPPGTSSTTYGVMISIFSCVRARSSMICEARNSSRRWTIVTLDANFVRKRASSMAESPPPDHDLALAIESPAARRAVGDAAAVQLRSDSSPSCARSPGGHDDGLREVLVVADVDLEQALGEVDAGDVVGEEVGAEALGLGAELGHHPRSHHAVAVAGIVLDLARDHQLPAPVEMTFDHEGLRRLAQAA